jgi:pimeloyl-ACP methyl ester carboxylesterase
MPEALVRGVHIHYEIVGTDGPWVALSPGGHRDISGVRGIGEQIAAQGFRVLLHDRRNCGNSDVAITGEQPEYEAWADDLHELLRQLGGLPAFVGGSSSGCRTALLFALRHPEAVSGLLLWRVTGGRFAATRLAEEYYGQYVDLARQGGMAAICETPYFKERIDARPTNRDVLMKLDPNEFAEIYSRWRDSFLDSVDLPVIGATAEALRSITVPTCVIPGNDRTHGRKTGETASQLIPNAELHLLEPEDVDEVVADWDHHDGDIAAIFCAFLKKQTAASSTAAR